MAKATTKAASKSAASKKPAGKKSASKGANSSKAAATAEAGSAKAGSTPAKGKAKANSKGSSKGLDSFLESQLRLLEEERVTYLRQAESLQAEADSLTEDREPGDVQFDEESGEGDTLAVERERDLALSAQARAAIEEIDVATAKIYDGSYGKCVKCGKSIPKERLKALPHTALCVQCKSGGLGLGR